MEEKNCNNCNRNSNGAQGTLYGLIILVLVCVAGYLYAQNLHLQKEVDHYKYYFDDGYDDSDDDVLSQILKPFMGDSDSGDSGAIRSENGHFDENDNWIADPDDGYNNSVAESYVIDDSSSKQYSDDYSAEKDSITKIDKSSSGQCDNYEKFIKQSQ